MNASAERPAAAPRQLPSIRLERPSQGSGSTYALGLLAALAFHAGAICFWPAPKVITERVEFGVESADSSVEVSLVAALPAEEPVQAVEPPPEPAPVVTPPPPEPVPEPPPVVPEKEPEMTISAAEPKPTPPPVHVVQKPKPEKPAPAKPVAPARATGDGSSAVPGNDATTARASAGALGAKPGYLRNPHPAYPEDARAAGQQGTVNLFVRVDEQGRVVAVRVTRSSGFASLDERARSTVATQWAFKPAKAGGVAVASDVVIPIQFTLNK